MALLHRLSTCAENQSFEPADDAHYVVSSNALKGGVKVRQVADEKCDTWLNHK